MDAKKIVAELDNLEAMAETMRQRCAEIRRQLGVEKPKKPNKYADAVNKVLANHNKTLLKKSK